jgi:DNA modification methylase
VIWNVIQRYTKEGDLVVDPFAGSGTTLDVAAETKRRARGFDVAPYHAGIERADARRLPLDSATVDLVFLDPPYGDHIHYSEEPDCIGRLSAYDPAYYRAMDEAIAECARVLGPLGHIALYVSDYFEKKRGFAPVGMRLMRSMTKYFEILDVVCVVRHNKALDLGNYHRAADEGNFYLRGFNYLFLGQKPAEARPEKSERTLPVAPRKRRRTGSRRPHR